MCSMEFHDGSVRIYAALQGPFGRVAVCMGSCKAILAICRGVPPAYQ